MLRGRTLSFNVGKLNVLYTSGKWECDTVKSTPVMLVITGFKGF